MAKNTQLDLSKPSLQAPALPKPLPGLVEYKVDGVLWRCNRFDLLAAEFPITAPDQLPTFQGVAMGRERAWLIVRRLFGMQPVVPPASTAMEDMRPWQREELAADLGLTRAQMQAELDAVRGAWVGVAKSAPAPEAPAPKAAAREEFLFADDDLLTRHGFTMRFGSVDERNWFAQRVRDYEKVLNEKFASVLARNALMTELRIYQLDAFLNDTEKCKTGESSWKANLKLRQELDGNYQDLLKQIRDLCPWAGAVAGKFAFAGVMSDVTKAIQEYAARNDTRLVDGIFTATEIQVECHRSVQVPDPRYRAGLVTYLNAAKAGLWDPNWKPAFEFSLLRRIDAGWKAGFVAAGDESGEKLPDLEQDGPAGEYDSLKLPEGIKLTNDNEQPDTTTKHHQPNTK